MNIEINLATTDAEREAICRLRYEVYVEEMNIFGAIADEQNPGRRIASAGKIPLSRNVIATRHGGYGTSGGIEGRRGERLRGVSPILFLGLFREHA